jgi:hypothetical protein
MNAPRIISSAKFQAAWLATVVMSVSLYFTVSNKDAGRPEKQAAIEHYLWAVAGVWGVSTAATGAEDYAKNRDKPAGVGGTGPSVQVNTGSDATNVSGLSTPKPAVRVDAIGTPPSQS